MKCFNKSSNQCKNRNIQHKGGYVACHLHANDPTDLNYSALCSHKFNIFSFGPHFTNCSYHPNRIKMANLLRQVFFFFFSKSV